MFFFLSSPPHFLSLLIPSPPLPNRETKLLLKIQLGGGVEEYYKLFIGV